MDLLNAKEQILPWASMNKRKVKFYLFTLRE
jgi:hypothetical protein